MAHKLPTRALGSQGLVSSAQGLGCMGMTAFYHDADHNASDEESLAVIARAKELGVTMLDTSDVYGPHTNEVLLSKALKDNREDYVLATKFAIRVTGEKRGIDCSPAYVKEACEASLQRLGIDVIDLYYMHRKDPDTPIEDTVRAMKELVEAGKVRYVGLSEVTPDEIRRAHAVHPITAVQLEWSLWTRDAEAEVIPTCRELGIGIVAYSPLGRGFLAAKYKSTDALSEQDWRRSNPRFKGEAFDKNLKLVENVEKIAAKKGITPGQLALAWLHHQGDDVFPIPGTKRMKYLDENVAAFSVKLTPEELSELEAAVPASEVVGSRYDESMMGSTFLGRMPEK